MTDSSKQLPATEVKLPDHQLEQLAQLIADRLVNRKLSIYQVKPVGRFDASVALGVSLSTLDRLIDEGLPVIRPSKRRVVIDLEEARRWLGGRTRNG